MKYYLAIDIGASSGRHIVGWQENGEIFRAFSCFKAVFAHALALIGGG